MATLVRIGFLCLTLFLTHVASAQTTVTCTTNYYTVRGATIREIHESFRQARPWKTKSTLDAQTVWTVNWRFTVASSSSACRVTTFSTTTTITITLPLWTAPTNATDFVKTEWQRYFKALSQHEQGHVQFGLAAAAEIQKQMKSIGEDPSCENLKQRLNSLGHNVVKSYKQQDDAYDQRTEHGATQGARLGRGPRPPTEPRP
jgi:predicted secreted Zn-dependent protease